MQADFHAQLHAFFEQQQALFTQWLTPSPEAIQTMSNDQMKAAAMMASKTAGFLKQSTQLLEQLKAKALDKGLIDSLIRQLSEQTQQHSLDSILKQWQIPHQFQAAIEKSAAQNPNALFSTWRHTLLFTCPEFHAMHEERIKAGCEHLANYQAALHTYIQQSTQITESAVNRLKHALEHNEQPIESLNQLHELWVCCYEDAYAEAIRQETYQQAYGNITNCYMALVAFQQDMQLSAYEQQGLATHKGLDSTLQQQKALHKEMKAVKKQLEEQRLLNEQLTHSLIELSQQFEQIGGNLLPKTSQATQE